MAEIRKFLQSNRLQAHLDHLHKEAFRTVQHNLKKFNNRWIIFEQSLQFNSKTRLECPNQEILISKISDLRCFSPKKWLLNLLAGVRAGCRTDKAFKRVVRRPYRPFWPQHLKFGWFFLMVKCNNDLNVSYIPFSRALDSHLFFKSYFHFPGNF